MRKIIFSTLVTSLMISGCKFGEYANSDTSKTTSSTINDGVRVYKFSKENVENKTLFKVFKKDDEYKIVEYDFNVTKYKANPVVGDTNSYDGKFEISKEGYLWLEIADFSIWVRALNEDSDKISLLWKQNKSDLNSTSVDDDVYFFKRLDKAKEFIKKQ